MAEKNIQFFYAGIFQVAENAPVEDVGPMCDDLLESAYAILGIVEGSIPHDVTITSAAKFLIAAAQAGYRSLSND